MAIHDLIQQLNAEQETLGTVLCTNAGIEDEQAQAEHLALSVAPQMEALRDVCDSIESIVEDSRWRLPKYREMLFQN